ncbi:hypothetical protein [Brevundimonas subvibrioides]|uniref:Uncharacterized protein n=1 Tax=Brevundimonas subvibrioides (strain ATCC 15264 / DSM 4735 / LMG 14903 / NBRC 16000 / CB 81) TaxID=633149 RepID=D9QFZ7_BRESC|nr:hypothetical protein [Brevundimonas subvibrioides]ADL00711.1 hypothetical protein Bresu_1399 [Brevundimonas subvibrioides ATCC 15264]
MSRLTRRVATLNKGGGAPDTIIVSGQTLTLLFGRDSAPLQGRDGQYLYGRA